MFGIGFPELLLILAIALMVIGPKRLPDIAKALGRALGEFKRATEEFKTSINEESRTLDIRKQILDSVQAPGKSSSPPKRPDPSATDGPQPASATPETPLGPRADAVSATAPEIPKEPLPEERKTKDDQDA